MPSAVEAVSGRQDRDTSAARGDRGVCAGAEGAANVAAFLVEAGDARRTVGAPRVHGRRAAMGREGDDQNAVEDLAVWRRAASHRMLRGGPRRPGPAAPASITTTADGTPSRRSRGRFPSSGCRHTCPPASTSRGRRRWCSSRRFSAEFYGDTRIRGRTGRRSSRRATSARRSAWRRPGKASPPTASWHWPIPSSRRTWGSTALPSQCSIQPGSAAPRKAPTGRRFPGAPSSSTEPPPVSR